MSWEEFNKISHFLYEYIDTYAKEKPDAIALIDADDGKKVTWKEFANAVDIFTLDLIKMGLRKGDIIISSLPFLLEQVYLEFACFKIGALFCPLDLRLKASEIVRSVDLLKARAKMYVHLGNTDRADFADFAKDVQRRCSYLDFFLQFSMPEDCNKNTISILDFISEARENWREASIDGTLPKTINEARTKVEDDDPILIIYTTGTTGFPKPAMLTNRGITAQNLCLSRGFNFTNEDRMLVNLPPSHVGGQTEQLMTTIFTGGISVLLHIFDAEKSLQAINNYKATVLGQIPAMFEMQWRLENYNDFDLSSLIFAIYGGQSVSKPFLEKLSTMAPKFGSGLGLTEISGFCSYTPLEGSINDIMESLGYDFPISPLSIRKPMNADGTAGDELPDGEIGEICYTGPQVFKGYFGNEKATRKTISLEGVLYTGDLGYKDGKGLHLVGRSKFVIKPKGYQIYPPEVEAIIEEMPEIGKAAIVGAKHKIYSEGVVAFIELKKGKTVTKEQIMEHCKGIAAYKRPSLIMFLDEIPLNRVQKTDYKTLLEEVGKYIQEARSRGEWDEEKK
ncbi:MAG: acyl--CoA ligase [Candidatus Helarchaeota archaeon]|nr:acyl--CoA ligase [Candidatus Helarchaeota archaeon]